MMIVCSFHELSGDLQTIKTYLARQVTFMKYVFLSDHYLQRLQYEIWHTKMLKECQIAKLKPEVFMVTVVYCGKKWRPP